MSGLYNEPILLPDRVQPLIVAQTITGDGWKLVRSAVRPELATPYLDRALTAINAGLNDAAINYVWNLVEEDLRSKVVAYGIEYFADAVKLPGLRTREGLVEDIKSAQLLEGCFLLGIIGKEAYFYLDHCREVRNQYSAAHMTSAELDLMETGNFIKNCIKYSLGHDLPAAGFSLKEFLDYIAQPDVHVDEAFAFLESQSSRIYGAVAHRFFTEFVEPTTGNELRAAVKALAPRVWALLDEDVRAEVATRYARLKERPSPNHSEQALEFLKIVNGVGYVPDSLRAVIFNRYSQNLLDAWGGIDNFYNEPAPARALLELGSGVPMPAVKLYAKANLLSFIGNYYGYSLNAAPHTEKMLLSANPGVLAGLNAALKNDASVLAALQNTAPAKRFKLLAPALRERATDPALIGLLDDVIAKEWNFVVNEMRRRYEALQVKK